MAEPEEKSKEDEIVSKLVKDPDNPPETLLLAAFLGRSSEENHTRLYLDPQLKYSIEVPDDAILHTQKLDQPLGGSYVWVSQDAEVVYGEVGPNRPKAKLTEVLMYFAQYPWPYTQPSHCRCNPAQQAGFCLCSPAQQAGFCLCSPAQQAGFCLCSPAQQAGFCLCSPA
ncbi:MAG: hypothetical protein GY856_04885, partial [bacterium]|nr:hypothetical protein [bacterium]